MPAWPYGGIVMDWNKYASTINTVVVTVAIVASGIWAVVVFRADANTEREAQDGRIYGC
jgi:hypothetical protein